MRLLIEIPSEMMGDITSEITGRRGSIAGFEPHSETTTVQAIAPLAEVQRFGPQLRSLTHGRGRFTLEFDHFAEVPAHVQERILAERAAREPAR
jgi:elongation factor G